MVKSKNDMEVETLAERLDKVEVLEEVMKAMQQCCDKPQDQKKKLSVKSKKEPKEKRKKFVIGESSKSKQRSKFCSLCSTCHKQHRGLCHQLTRACFKRGKLGHQIKDSSKI
ncbi:hypothetical protein LOK49_LG02G03468 [Camellia lanceoleosa]|uniref:Uncharacterized protein n=1 Tax=Camellia lanceoleosa TaxID=1840588 RepID=A0ACC0IMJ3_9ERIC|nr:hypothetical protein LOK49_LG02G03468 [Camellia lanceoleosa]